MVAVGFMGIDNVADKVNYPEPAVAEGYSTCIIVARIQIESRVRIMGAVGAVCMDSFMGKINHPDLVICKCHPAGSRVARIKCKVICRIGHPVDAVCMDCGIVPVYHPEPVVTEGYPGSPLAPLYQFKIRVGNTVAVQVVGKYFAVDKVERPQLVVCKCQSRRNSLLGGQQKLGGRIMGAIGVVYKNPVTRIGNPQLAVGKCYSGGSRVARIKCKF